jgi:hypothetical protein
MYNLRLMTNLVVALQFAAPCKSFHFCLAMGRLVFSAVAGCVLIFPQPAAAIEVMLPNVRSLGAPVDKVPLMTSSNPTVQNVEFPRRITLDIYDGKLEGMVFLFNKDVSPKDIAKTIADLQTGAHDYPEMAKYGLWAWRNEKLRYALQLSTSNESEFGAQVILVWLDRQRPVGEEAIEISDEVMRRQSTIEGRSAHPNPDAEHAK